MPAVPTIATGAYLRPSFLLWLHNKPVARLRRNSAQPIPSGTGTAVAYTVEDLDTDPEGVGGHSTSTNTSRYTARYPGWYRATGGLAWVTNTTGRRGCWWAKNGTAVDGSESMLPAGSGVLGVVARPILVYLAEGDYLELIAYQESGVSLNLSGLTFEMPSMDITWERI